MQSGRPCARLLLNHGSQSRTLPGFRAKSQRFFAHHIAQTRIQPGKRLVHQQYTGPRGHGPRESYPLLFTTREIVRIIFPAIIKTDTVEHFESLVPAPTSRQMVEPKRYIFKYRQMREQRIVLKHQRPIPRFSGGRNCVSPPISRLSNKTEPAVWRAMPAAMRNNVVLPEPDGPKRHVTVPERAVNETSSRIFVPSMSWLTRSKVSSWGIETPAVLGVPQPQDSSPETSLRYCSSRGCTPRHRQNPVKTSTHLDLAFKTILQPMMKRIPTGTRLAAPLI